MISHQNLSASLLSDFCDGSYYKAHTLFNGREPTLQIFLYFDELEVCNPLGSKRIKHKIGKLSHCMCLIINF